jgi:N-acetylmuramoyl-L-alanine amidase
VLGHSDIAPARKEDPGELFPWQRLAEAGIGLWPQKRDPGLGPEALARFGYDPGAPQDKVITAFQRHFRPRKLDGVWDAECGQLLAGLLA